MGRLRVDWVGGEALLGKDHVAVEAKGRGWRPGFAALGQVPVLAWVSGRWLWAAGSLRGEAELREAWGWAPGPRGRHGARGSGFPTRRHALVCKWFLKTPF